MGITWLLPNVTNPSCVGNYASIVNYPFPGRGMGKYRKAQARPGVFINSAQHHCQVWKGVQPHCSVGTSAPSMLPNSTRGGLQICATSRCKQGLTICLCVTEWHHGSCGSIRWRTCQHHDRQHAQCWCLQLATSVAGAQAVAAQGEGSVSRGLKQAPWGTTVHFLRATLLGCHCSQWAL